MLRRQPKTISREPISSKSWRAGALPITELGPSHEVVRKGHHTKNGLGGEHFSTCLEHEFRFLRSKTSICRSMFRNCSRIQLRTRRP
jgi:hypothetical protein